MDIAQFSDPKYADNIYEVSTVNDNGCFELDMDYFAFHYCSKITFNKKFNGIFSDPREPKTEFFTPWTGYTSYFGAKPYNSDQVRKQIWYYANIAVSIQVLTEEIMIKMAGHVYKETGFKNLYMAGGVALNSVVKKKDIELDPPLIYIQPAPDGLRWSIKN